VEGVDIIGLISLFRDFDFRLGVTFRIGVDVRLEVEFRFGVGFRFGAGFGCFAFPQHRKCRNHIYYTFTVIERP